MMDSRCAFCRCSLLQQATTEHACSLRCRPLRVVRCGCTLHFRRPIETCRLLMTGWMASGEVETLEHQNKVTDKYRSKEWINIARKNSADVSSF